MATSPSDTLLLQSTLLCERGFSVHGFTTKQGGVSQGAFASWNFSTSTGDSEETVSQNYELLALQLGTSKASIVSVHQIHSADLVLLEQWEQLSSSAKADGILSSLKGAVVGVKTADCVPVLMADPVTGYVAAIHAGWRGVAGEIVPNALALLREKEPNASPVWAIGPHICGNCFQVGEEVASVFPAFARQDPSTDGKFLVDLRSALVHQLCSLGIAKEAIDHVEGCPMCDPLQRFFSHRKSAGKCGRMFNFIGLL